MKKLLITGASGFIGGWLLEEAISQGYEVYAGIRKSSSKEYLGDERIRFFEMDLMDPSHLQKQFKEFVDSHGTFDYIIHNAGVTKAKRKADYYSVNLQGTKNLALAIQSSKALKTKFIFISSLAAAGPGVSQVNPILLTDAPNPVTSYGKSKLEAEQFLQGLKDFPCLIIRPTNVYGPRERDIFIFFKLINKHFEPYIGLHSQSVSFIFVKDLVKAILLGVETSIVGKTYFASDGKEYVTRDLGRAIKKHLNKWTLSFSLPIFLVKGIAILNELSGHANALNLEKINELEAKNWLCDVKPLMEDLGFKPDFDLDSGIRATASWYKQAGWLK